MATPKPKPGPLTQIKLFEHDREFAFARFTPCGKYLIAGGYDALLHRWDLAGNQKTAVAGHDGWLQGLVFHPDQKRMFTLDSWSRLSAWNYAEEKAAPLWSKSNTHKGWAKHLGISPDGALLATCGVDQIVRLWSSKDGEFKAELKGHGSQVFCVHFHPDGKSLVSGDLLGNIKHWDLQTLKSVRELAAPLLYLRADEINDVGGVRCLAFDPAGRTLVCAGAQPITSGFVTAKPAVILFDWASGKEKQLLQLPNAAAEDGFAFDVAHHATGLLAVACGGSPGRGALWLWKPGERSPAYVNKELPHCRSVSLHNDGLRIALTQVARADGNGRKLDAKGEYPGNTSSVRIYELRPA
jgi:WD40 repeat protein